MIKVGADKVYKRLFYTCPVCRMSLMVKAENLKRTSTFETMCPWCEEELRFDIKSADIKYVSAE